MSAFYLHPLQVPGVLLAFQQLLLQTKHSEIRWWRLICFRSITSFCLQEDKTPLAIP